jgi:polyribonucleotide nucleotidyltransferase
MVESEASGLSEDVMLGAVVFGHEQMQIAIKTINEMVAAVGKPKWEWAPSAASAELDAAVAANAKAALSEAYLITEKQSRYSKVAEIKAACTLALAGGDAPKYTADDVDTSLFKLESNIVRQRILNGEPRIDGRNATTVRPITVKVGVLPRTHGSALFTRGETQALVATTLGTGRDAQIIDALEGERREPFMFHYNFPPFSVGETGMMGSPKRREIGHGNLARRGIAAMMPDMENSHTSFASSRKFWSRTAPRRWPRCVALRCRSWTRAYRSRRRSRALPWASCSKANASRSSPTSWVTKITWATWTSRLPVRRTASPRCRWTSRSKASRPKS